MKPKSTSSDTALDAALEELSIAVFGGASSSMLEGINHTSSAARRILLIRISAVEGPILHNAVRLLSPSASTPSAIDLIKLGTCASRIMRGCAPGKTIAIDDVVAGLILEHALPHDQSEERVLLLRQAVFALIGCLCGLYTAQIDPRLSTLVLRACGSDQHETSKDSSLCERPISSVVKALRALKPLDAEQQVATNSTLQVRLLNASALSLDITGRRVQIEWVDDLRAHLEFDEDSRTLYVFRWPTLCALHYFKSNDCASLLDITLQEQHVPAATLRERNATYLREVLLSYRLLFGQTKASRKVFDRRERKAASSTSLPNGSGGTSGFIDPLLVRLCSGKDPLSDMMIHHGVSERDVYTSQFTLLRDRLLRIQNFINSHQAVRIRDHWRDRANKVEWTAFWSLLVVGILSIVLSIVQIALAAAQLQAA